MWFFYKNDTHLRQSILYNLVKDGEETWNVVLKKNAENIMVWKMKKKKKINLYENKNNTYT